MNIKSFFTLLLLLLVAFTQAEEPQEEPKEPPYVIIDDNGKFITTKAGILIGTISPSIQDVIDAIIAHTEGYPCEIQFGNGSYESEIDLGTANINFDGSNAGQITISGNITSSNTSTNGIIYLTNGMNLESKARIGNLGEYGIVNKSTGTLTINNGWIFATKYAIYNASTGSVVLNVEDGYLITIMTGLGKLYADASFNGYASLDFLSYTLGEVAVENGARFLSKFELADKAYMLKVDGDDLVIAETEYTYDKSGTKYTITKAKTTGLPIQDLIDNIKNNADGATCEIQFENLDIGSAHIEFGGTGWGQVTLSGKIASSAKSQAAIYIKDNVSLESKADIKKTNSYAIVNGGTGTLTISGGNISATTRTVQNDATGKIIIKGGEISSSTSLSSYAVYNISTGEIAISGGSISGSYGVYNASTGEIAISGGTVQGGYAVYNYAGKITINGGSISTLLTSVTTGGEAVYNSSSGFVTLGGNPNITGTILVDYEKLSIDNGFNPGNKLYLLYFSTYTVGNIAVKNGSTFLNNFELYNGSYSLTANADGDLVVADAKFAFTKNGEIYIITKVQSSGQPIQDLIDAIKADAGGANCSIQFGENGKELNIGNSTITFKDTGWGTVTLSGKIISQIVAISLNSNISLNINADIKGGNNGAISNLSTSGNINITGGNISGTNAAVRHQSSSGRIFISGNANISSTGTSYSSGTIFISGNGNYDKVEITGGTITNTGANGNAIYNNSSGFVTFGGNPKITGHIMDADLNIILTGANAFAPSDDKIYTLYFWSNPADLIAVKNGANFLTNFAIVSDNYDLAVKNTDIVLETSYIITGSGNAFSVAKGGTIIGEANKPIKTIINTIKNDAEGLDCYIRFGNGNDTLNIGEAYINFDGTGWGKVTLLGKITSSSLDDINAVIYLSNGASVDSRAEIFGNFDGELLVDAPTYAIRNGNGDSGALTISSGIVTAFTTAILNDSTGTVTVNGGAVGGFAGGILNNSTGTVIINGGNIQTLFGSIINISTGTIIINGGTVESVWVGGIINSIGAVIVNGGTVKGADQGAIVNDSIGTITVNGGTITATSKAIASYGKVTISGNPIIRSEIASIDNGAIFLEKKEGNTDTGIMLEITGGTIINSAGGNAIYNASSGTIAMGGSPNITGNIAKLTTAGNLSIITEGEKTFAPGNKTYNLDFSSYSTGIVAVENGKEFLDNFKLPAIANWKLIERGNDIVVLPLLNTYTVIVTNGSGSGIYAVGETVALVANVMSEGIVFKGWEITDGIVISDNTFAMPAKNVTATAIFETLSGYTFAKTGTTYTITKTATAHSIQDIINSIKTDAGGAPCSIYFGSDADILDIGAASIEFGGTGWGKITLLGKIKSSNTSANGAIYISSNTISMDSKADIIKTSGYAINNKSSGTLTISDGTISATSYAVFNFSSGTIDITGGTISANANAVYNASTGIVSITGGTISAQENASAVYNVMGSIVLGSSPSITGYITKLAPTSTLSILADFAPGENIYTIDFARYLEGNIAVANGSEFAQNFALANKAWQLTEKNNALIASGQTSPIINKTIALENIPANAKVQIYNIKGKFLYNSQFSALNSQLSKLQAGVYIIKTNNQSFKVTVK